MPPNRVTFTKEHDNYLLKYLARHNPTKEGRSGNKVFERLVAEENRRRWPWAVHHSWQSWRERYVKNAVDFDKLILDYQRKHDIKPALKDKRKRGAEPRPIEMLEPSAKRAKSSSGESRAGTQPEKASGSGLKSKSRQKQPREAPETPSRTQNSTQPTSIRRAGPPTSPPRSRADGSTIERQKPVSESKPTMQTPTQDEDDSIEILSPSPARSDPFSTAPRSPPRHVKLTKVRVSDEFASEPPSPKMDGAAQGSSSQAQPVPPHATTVYPRAPPRVVDSLHGQVLVNRQGHLPRPFPPVEKEEVEEEEEKEETNKSQWPPARGRIIKQKRAIGPDVEVQAHHPFSQPPSKAEVPQIGERAQMRRTVAAQFTGQTYPAPAQSERRESGSSPVKRIVTAAPPSNPFAGQISRPFSKVFPAPRVSTRSPFRPEPPAAGTRHPPSFEPRPRLPSRAKAARHPALTRVRRQSIANENRRERERRRDVPSLDLVTLSHSSMSRSGSHSSNTSIPVRLPRWSFPGSVHATSWVLDEPQQRPWHGQTRTLSMVGTSTPSPVLSVTNATAATSYALPSNLPTHPSPSMTRVPHAPDLQLVASHGLAMILAHMSANHGLALGVVDAVYERVGSLREADEVLKVMREAAEGSGEREIKRRMGRQRASGSGSGSGKERTELRYVVASEDGEGSEYSPPETSRAALWKVQRESASYAEEEEEEEEGREVEEELQNGEESEGEGERLHSFSRSVPLDDEMTGQDRHDGQDSYDELVTDGLLEDTKHAYELETRLGKARYRKEVIAKYFK